jgi:hypothetical protein
MAKVVIIIEDENEQGVKINMESDPAIKVKRPDEITNAQYLALIAMKAMNSVGGIESSETEFEE